MNIPFRLPPSALFACMSAFLLNSCAHPHAHEQGKPPAPATTPAAPTTLESARGQVWKLTQWKSLAGMQRIPGLVTLQLMEAGQVSGRGPVNRYFGSVEISGNEIHSWQPLASTRMAGPPEAMAAEAAYFGDLVTLRSATFENTRLILNSPAGVRMEFERTGGTAAPSP